MATTGHLPISWNGLPYLQGGGVGTAMQGNLPENLIFASNSSCSVSAIVEEARQLVSENQVVDRLLRHDKEAFAELYDNYSSAIYGIALKILKDEALAEDALQETFVRIWRKIQTYDPSKGRLFTWMLNIGRNIAIDMHRANESRKASSTSSLQERAFDSKGPSTTVQVEGIGIREIVDGLPPEQKQVIELIYYLGYTQSEVAEEFDIPLGTVKSRVRLAMNYLRAKIA